jgi:MFS transporter, OFA family, oxalate/formate antiporter
MMGEVMRTRSRLRVLVACIVMQAGLGTAYAWSVFRNPLADRFGWSLPEVSLTFSVMILTAGFGAFAGGLWLERAGPRRVAVASGVLYGGGIALAGLLGDRLAFLYLTYGVLAGAGLGLGYIVPIATLVRWFPAHRGLVTGIAVSSFAVGALAATPLDARLVEALGPLDALAVLGGVVLVVISTAGSFLRSPPDDVQTERVDEADGGDELTPGEALRTWRWWALWAIFFVSVTAGMGFVAEATPMAEELAGTRAVAASGLVGLLFVADAAGRLLVPWASDAVGRRAVLVAIFVGQAAAFATLTRASSPLAFVVLGALVVFLYGGSSGTMPALVADSFGTRTVGPIYGPMLTAWGVGGVLGPMVLAALRDSTGSYETGLLTISFARALRRRSQLRQPQPAGDALATALTVGRQEQRRHDSVLRGHRVDRGPELRDSRRPVDVGRVGRCVAGQPSEPVSVRVLVA